MAASIASDMLRLFHDGPARYQPAAPGLVLEEETGSAEVSTRNLNKLLAGDRVLTNIWVRAGRALVLFHSGETFLALGLSLDDPVKREAVTRLASENGYGDYETLKRFYDALPENYDSELPDAT